MPPTIVLVHGAWHNPACFDQLKAQLTPHFTVHVPARPSVGADADTKSFDDDIRLVQGIVRKCAEAGEDVFVVCHSSGGFVGPPAIENLSRAKRQREGQQGGVIGIGLIAAFIAPAHGMMFEGIEMDMSQLKWVNEATVMPADPAHMFYNDLPDAVAQHWVEQLRPAHMATLPTLKHEGWKDVPVFYLHCIKDQALAIAQQRQMVAKAREQGGNFHTEEFDSSHSPFLSMPEATAQWVERSVKAAEAA